MNKTLHAIALGPLLLERLEAEGFPSVECLTGFQLQVEHALNLEGRGFQNVAQITSMPLQCLDDLQAPHLPRRGQADEQPQDQHDQ